MKRGKNKKFLGLFCVILFFCIIYVSVPNKAGAINILRSHGGKFFPIYTAITMCPGGEPAFNLLTPKKTTEGPFGITPFTIKYKYFTTYGAPGRNMLLLASPIPLPICLQFSTNCPTGCPFWAYPVIKFGIALIPSPF